MIEEKVSSPGMSVVVKTVTGWVWSMILLFGVYVVFGETTPGGGFAGGVIIAGAFVLLILAYGGVYGLRQLNQYRAAVLASTGALIFIGAALSGLFFANVFFKNLTGASDASFLGLPHGTFIKICELGIGLLVSMSAFLVFYLLASTRIEGRE
jgi:multicomponent Na+:H+ antiporter subunit B